MRSQRATYGVSITHTYPPQARDRTTQSTSDTAPDGNWSKPALVRREVAPWPT